MKLQICHFYPDILNLSGDRGNILCLKKRLEWRGIEAEITRVTAGQAAPLSEFDIIYIGGGEDFAPGGVLNPELAWRFDELREAARNDAVILAVCGGFELLGKYIELEDGTKIELAGLLDMHTSMSGERIVGEFLFEGDGFGEAAAFENHYGHAFLADALKPLGSIIKGGGNNGSDGTEGARLGNIFASFAQGPLLPKNPALADMLLTAALSRKYPGAVLEPLDDEIENTARNYLARKIRAAE